MPKKEEQKINILLVEDNQDHAHFIKGVLPPGTYDITHIIDGKEAFAYISNPPKPFDVVLLDYYLPSMDGMAVLKKVLGNGREIAIIFLTVDDRVDTAVEVMKAGAMDFLPKVARFYERLPVMIEKVFDQHKIRLEKKRLEEQIKKSLQEKELLLKEVHHRVKNNLSIIYSMLHFQEQYAGGRSLETILVNTRNRIRTMALVHEKLYKAEDLTRIYLPGYCNELVTHLMDTLRPFSIHNHNAILYRTDVEEIYLDIDTIIPLGLIINELLTNALTHGFKGEIEIKPGIAPPEIRLGMRCESKKKCRLTVSDNGVGLPENFDRNRSESLGMFIIKSLVEQLEGKLEIRRLKPKGTEFLIRFNIGHKR